MGKWSTEENRKAQYEKSKLQKEKMEHMIQNLVQTWRDEPEQIAEMLEFGSRFYQYSLKNKMLIFKQNPNASYVQSYQAWEKLGAHIKKGEQGIRIYTPVDATVLKTKEGLVPLEHATKEQKELYKKGEIESITNTHFKLTSVFDISQTSYPVELYPKILSVGYSSDLHEKFIKGLKEYAVERLNCPIKTEDLKSITLRGYYRVDRHEIFINDKLQDTQYLSTLAHELGHALLHKVQSEKSPAQKELEADSLGIMLESRFGIQPTDSRKRHLKENYTKYMAEYQKDPERKESFPTVLQNVFREYNHQLPEIERYIGHYVPTIQSERNLPEIVASSQYEKIKENVGIIEYARMHGFELMKVGKYISMRDHDSVRIDPDRNCFWQNSGIGTNNAGSVIDFAANFVHNGDVHEALHELTGFTDDVTILPTLHTTMKKEIPSPVTSLKENLPEHSKNMHRAYAYLTKTRFIDPDVVHEFASNKMLYQDTRGNCVFVAYGSDNEPNFASFRGTLSDIKFLGDVRGSDYNRDFYINNHADKMIVTESVIDSMSVMSILKGQGEDYHAYDYLIQSGTEKYEAILTHLSENKKTEILLSLDHDKGGVRAMENITTLLEEHYPNLAVSYHVPEQECKDWNGQLTKAMKKMMPLQEVEYLGKKELPEIKKCAIQSSENVQEFKFHIRNGRHQYRLVQLGEKGLIEPMKLNGNSIYYDPKDLKALVPGMYDLISYKELEQMQQPVPTMKAGKLSIREIKVQDNLYIAVLETKTGIEEAIEKQKDMLFVQTGYAFDNTDEKHELNECAVNEFLAISGKQLNEIPEGMVFSEEVSIKQNKYQESEQIFLEQIQHQELEKNRNITIQPSVTLEL